jgi:hypothetical protein
MSGESFGLLIFTILTLLFFGSLVYYLFPRGSHKGDLRRELTEIGPCWIDRSVNSKNALQISWTLLKKADPDKQS